MIGKDYIGTFALNPLTDDLSQAHILAQIRTRLRIFHPIAAGKLF